MLPSEGQWVRWITADFGREGQVMVVRPPSMVIRWLGVDVPQVFPIAASAMREMEVIPEPAKAAQIDRQLEQGYMGVAAAAAALGITEKRIRQRLRSGSLRGKQEDGRWVLVELPRED